VPSPVLFPPFPQCRRVTKQLYWVASAVLRGRHPENNCLCHHTESRHTVLLHLRNIIHHITHFRPWKAQLNSIIFS
jgi:hypothetical protein